MSHVLVTGANGFVGRALCGALASRGHEVSALVRQQAPNAEGVREWVHPAADFVGLDEAWPRDLMVDCVVHVAARVHMLSDDAPDPEAAFHATNVDGTLRVAYAAHAGGAKRFVFVSSIKAVAETDAGVPLDEAMRAEPADPYGRSKHAAEQALWRLRDELGIEIVVVRPPLVYGPGVGANFLQMMNALSRGIPLPLASVHARRSMVYAANLADALVRCATDSRAANECFHVCDGEDPTVAALLRELGGHLSRPARLVPVPPALLRLAGTLLGRSAQMQRLTSSLQVNGSRIRAVLDWQPPYSLHEGLEATARWYRALR